MADNMYRDQQQTGALSASREMTNAFLRGVYLWMGVGLAITSVVSWYIAGSDTIMNALSNNTFLLILLIVAQLGLVVALSAAMHKMSSGMATGLFMFYSAMSGVTLAPIFQIYTPASIAAIFAACAGMFTAMSIYGLVTKRDLTSLGSFMFMGLIGIIIASLVNLFLKSQAIHYITGYIGVIVFLGLTAYDTQKLRNMGESAPHDDAVAIRRGTILGALTLYLDFINLFLMLLRIFGDRR